MEPELTESGQLKLLKTFGGLIIVDKADGTHSVEGVATSEAVDKDNEIADYAGTLKAIKSWSDDAVAKTTGNGQETSLGNIRLQHDGKIIAGKMTGYDPDDKAKKIAIKTQPLNSIYDDYVLPGMVTGFSIAGGYVSRNCNECKAAMPGRGNFCPDCKKSVVTRYIPSIVEISYVDNACNPDATFTHVKANGGTELRKFSDLRKEHELKQATTEDQSALEKTIERVLVKTGLAKEKKTKKVGGKDLPASAFAYVGDPDDTSTWKLPIHDAAHCRNALARFNQTQGIPAGEKAKVKAKIVAAAKKFGIEVSEKSAKCVRFALVKVADAMLDASNFKFEGGGEAVAARVEEVFAKVDGDTQLFKGLYTVSSLAEVLQSLQWIVASTEYERDYEGDDSEVPDDLRQALEDLIPIFIAMASEEANELLTQTKKAAIGGKGGTSMDAKDADLLKAAKELATKMWKKAKSIFHKMAKEHGGLAKTFHKAAEHHENIADHCTNCAEAGAEKTVLDELEKLNTADFQKTPKVDQLLAKAEVLEKAKGLAGHFGKMAKCHGHMAKCMTKAAGHCEDLDKAAVAVGDAEDEIDMQSREKDDKDAHQGGSSEKSAKEQADAIDKAVKEALEKSGAGKTDPELAKQLTAVTEMLKTQGQKLDDAEKANKELNGKLEKALEAGPKAAAHLAVDDKHKNEEDKKDKNALASSSTTKKGVGAFGV